MKKLLIMTLFLVMAVSAKKNPYTVEGYDEYETTTRPIQGSWTIEEAVGFLPNGQMGTKFTEGALEFTSLPRKGSRGEYILLLKLTNDLIKERVSHYGETEAERKEVQVTEYWIVIENDWYGTRDGLLVLYEGEVFIPQIIGKGENLSSFVAKEASLIGATSSEKSGGGFGGFIAATVIQSSSEVDNVLPELEHFSGDITHGEEKITVTKGSRTIILTK